MYNNKRKPTPFYIPICLHGYIDYYLCRFIPTQSELLIIFIWIQKEDNNQNKSGNISITKCVFNMFTKKSMNLAYLEKYYYIIKLWNIFIYIKCSVCILSKLCQICRFYLHQFIKIMINFLVCALDYIF